MRYRFLFCIMIICILSGCSKKEDTDAYLSLGELLATERAVDSTTKETQTTSESVTDSTKEDSTEASTTEIIDETLEITSADTTYVDTVPLHSSKAEETTETTTQAQTTAAALIRTEPVPTNYFFSDSYKTAANTLVFSPRELYYENGRLHATMYVYNGHTTPATNIHNVYLSFDNGQTAIAEANFDTMAGCSIAPNCYVLWNFTFPNEGVYLNNTTLLSINTTYETTYNY